jgi:hypothetical protein
MLRIDHMKHSPAGGDVTTAGLVSLAILLILGIVTGFGGCGDTAATRDRLPSKGDVEALLEQHGYTPSMLIHSVPATVADRDHTQLNYQLQSPGLGGEALLLLCEPDKPENVQGLMAMRTPRKTPEEVRARDAHLETFAEIVAELTGIRGICGDGYRTGKLRPRNSGQITLPGWTTVEGAWEVIVMTADPESEDPPVMFFIVRKRTSEAGS